MGFMTKSFSELERWEGGFPGQHEFTTLDSLPAADPENPGIAEFHAVAERVVAQWHGNQFAGLVLYGTTGTGKTTAAMGLGRAMHDTGAEVHYLYVPGLDDSDGQIGSWSSYRSSSGIDGYAFPSTYVGDAVRNPKSVLILDDFKPEKQRQVSAAVEAAAQFGGFVVITSNHEDPFRIVEPPRATPTPEEAALTVLLQRENPEMAAQVANDRVARAAEISVSLRSRIAAGFRFIEFSGPDHRMQQSFWA
jgi:hypothetical protein